MRLPDYMNGETAIDVLSALESIPNKQEVDAYLEKVFVSWHAGKLGDQDANVVMGLSPEEYSSWAMGKFVLSNIRRLASASEVSSNIQEEIEDVLVEGGVDELMEMAMNLRQADTGLPVVIWVSTREAYGSQIKHGPRIKVMSTKDQKAKRDLMYSMDVEPPYVVRKSQDMRLDASTVSLVRLWVKKNQEWLKKYWEDEMPVTEFLKAISPDKDAVLEDNKSNKSILKWTMDYDIDDLDDAVEHINLMRQRMMDDPLGEHEPDGEDFEEPEDLLPEKSFKGKEKGWLKSLPRETWAEEMKKVHNRDYSKILALPELNSVIVIDDEIGDGFGRAILAHALGEKVYVQRFVSSEGEDLFEMSNLREKDTGIPLLIWVSAKNAKHGPRLKVQWGDDISKSVSVSLHKNNPTVVAGDESKLPKGILSDVKKWIIANYETLMAYWRLEIGTIEMGSRLKHLDKLSKKEDFLQEDSWAVDVGKLRSELGEIEEIYKDFDSLEMRIGTLTGMVSDTSAKSLMAKSLRYLISSERQVELAESKLLDVTKTPKSPRRNPIKQSIPDRDFRKELIRVSNDIGLLSVRVRNIGQAVFNDVSSSNVPNIRDISDLLEKSSETVRKAFVAYEKALSFV